MVLECREGSDTNRRGFGVGRARKPHHERSITVRLDEVGLARLAYVAATTGARLVRDRASMEPMDWLLARLELFDGKCALEVCWQEQAFNRAVVLHGLARSYDAPPARLSGIPASAFLSPAAGEHLLMQVQPAFSGSSCEIGAAELYTCSISAEIESGHVQIFCAMIANSPAEVRRRLRQRFGLALEDEAIVRLGFDRSEPLACAMVSEAMAHVLDLAAAEPRSCFAEGLDFQVEQRFAK